MGDEQGGAYHPEALVWRTPSTSCGSTRRPTAAITGLRRVVRELGERDFTTHMFPHVHSRLFSALGFEGEPIEWGITGNGVDQVSDTFTRPVVDDGWMEPLPQRPRIRNA